MAYRDVDTGAYKKAYAKKKKSKRKPLKIASMSIDQTMAPKSNRPGKKPKKKLTFKDETKIGGGGGPELAKKPEHLGEKGFKLKFGDAFRIAKKDGKKVFTWKGNKYTTQTKAELETGKSEKARFERAAKSKKVPNNQSNWNKFKNSKTLAEFFGKLKK